MYELPFGQGKRFCGSCGALVDRLIGGWKLTAIGTEQSGFPLTFSAAGTGAGTRPNLVPGVSPQIQGNRSNQQRVTAWFNNAAFVTPAPYTYGTVGRTFTQVLGPGVHKAAVCAGTRAPAPASDHGEMLGDHGMYLKGPYFYDCLTRVPLIIRWPGRFKASTKVEALVELIDLAPTLLECAGIPVPSGMQGRSLGPLLRGETTTHRDSVYMEYLDANAAYSIPPMLTSVRTDRYKLALCDKPRSGEL